MVQKSETQNEAYTVSAADLKALMLEAETSEQQSGRKFARMARGASNTDSKIGTISGVGLGLLAGVGLASGIVPGAEALANVSSLLPVAGGAFFAAIGLLVGTYIDLHSVTGRD